MDTISVCSIYFCILPQHQKKKLMNNDNIIHDKLTINAEYHKILRYLELYYLNKIQDIK